MGFTREQIHQIRESIKVGSFCKKWWKMLSKEIKVADISKFQKMEVFVEIAKGLIREAYNQCEMVEDYSFVNKTITEELEARIINE